MDRILSSTTIDLELNHQNTKLPKRINFTSSLINLSNMNLNHSINLLEYQRINKKSNLFDQLNQKLIFKIITQLIIIIRKINHQSHVYKCNKITDDIN